MPRSSGGRVHDERVNVLTVIANESYERYVEGLQSEIEEAYGKEGFHLGRRMPVSGEMRTCERSTFSNPNSGSSGTG